MTQSPPPHWVPPDPAHRYPYPGGWTPPPQPVRVVPAAPSGAPLADFWYRLGAYVIDSLILSAVWMVIYVPVFAVVVITTLVPLSEDGRDVAQEPGPEVVLVLLGAFVLVMLIYLILSYLYFVEYQLRKGQTVGKRVLKIKVMPLDPAAVVDRTGYAKRWAVGHLLALVPFFSYLDGLWQLWDKPYQQCLHDKAAKTVVVRIG